MEEAKYRIVDSDSGHRVMDYASRAHADAWIEAHPDYRVYSQHLDSPNFRLYAIYVESARRHKTTTA